MKREVVFMSPCGLSDEFDQIVNRHGFSGGLGGFSRELEGDHPVDYYVDLVKAVLAEYSWQPEVAIFVYEVGDDKPPVFVTILERSEPSHL